MMKIRKMIIVIMKMSRSGKKSKVLTIKMRNMIIVSIKMSKHEKNDDFNEENEQTCSKIQSFGH